MVSIFGRRYGNSETGQMQEEAPPAEPEAARVAAPAAATSAAPDRDNVDGHG